MKLHVVPGLTRSLFHYMVLYYASIVYDHMLYYPTLSLYGVSGTRCALGRRSALPRTGALWPCMQRWRCPCLTHEVEVCELIVCNAARNFGNQVHRWLRRLGPSWDG